jgi:Winged helix-turn-helix DNA-binding
MHGSGEPYVETVGRAPWVFLSNHGYVLLAIADDPTSRIRDLAASAGLTERATLRIVRELVESGYVDCRKVGRRNVYRVNEEMPLRHPRFSGRPVRDLLDLARVVTPDEGGRVGDDARAERAGTPAGDAKDSRPAESGGAPPAATAGGW